MLYTCITKMEYGQSRTLQQGAQIDKTMYILFLFQLQDIKTTNVKQENDMTQKVGVIVVLKDKPPK